MASQKKIIEMIGSVKTIYPYYAKDTDVETLVRTWTVLLKDYPDKAVDVAFYKCLQICKMPPTPADVIEQLNSMAEALEPSDEELWSVYIKALRETDYWVYRFPFTAIQENGKSQGHNAKMKVQELWDNLPERLKQYIGSKGELIQMSRYSDEDLKYEKNRFMKLMPTIKNRETYSKIAYQLISSGENLRVETTEIKYLKE